ncbi:MAG TPA: hypothetical protein VFF76_09830 [Holophagaceae bacterium]|jgi:hypothetical protein|nr:hypothetical protein [Holophagaceae bacterium]
MLFPPALHQAPAPETPLPFISLKAQYKWSFRGAKDSGSGTLALRLEPAGGKLVLEVFTYGDRLALVDGDCSSGYQLVLPKENVNRTVPTLAELPLPFLPQAGSVEALARALANGEGEGLSVEKRDRQGPMKLRYTGRDSAGNPVEVQLTRKRWEPAK